MLETCRSEFGCKGVSGGPCLKAAHVDGQIQSMDQLVAAKVSRPEFLEFLSGVEQNAMSLCALPDRLNAALKRGREAAKKLI